MKVSYYPGCTLKTKAKNLEDAAVASMAALGVDFEELTRWNCCGAVHSLADDDLIHQVAPVRDLVRALEQGSDTVVTLCSMCYNTLARANLLMRQDEVKRKTINDFMNEERDYNGEVEVVHFLNFLRDQVGWDKVRAAVKVPLNGLKVAMYYGCTLVRPRNVAIEPIGDTKIMGEFLEAIGATPIDFADATTCCGSYQILANPDAANDVSGQILNSALNAGAEAVVLSCPLCEFNLSKKQPEVIAKKKLSKEVPVYYFTQLLAMALGLGNEACRFDLNSKCSSEFLKTKNFPV
ncbi:CoB--CoM heterodisulfide reductase iron-sulfur subunit B family protein [Desulforhabdus amnigena]|jgi:heterodisulfide reductase subunit B|uniref:Heterodisulfide reductase subunit B n=1 Tax=Desulforhabdus amnigena TaxID=40218 RepID=A0A9W6FTD9_9BACT|nr:CoB--CoM heterodisulfide reductase iron-sulfur subunit B family protein [Desulforhabdus amnigena]NLJ28995.1 heterodisulfide reductase, subunit B [Deltaproteobacteria bacterium]GLI33650.1 heterodisulfide reductase subunit B [Desulforhabdus amnigena]